MTTSIVKTLTIHRKTLEFVRVVDGETVQQGTLQHRRVLDSLCGLYKHIGYTVIIQSKKGTTPPMNTDKLSRKQREQIDLNHYNALRELQASGFPEKIHPTTRTALIKRGFLDINLPAPCITAAGLEFLGDAVPAGQPEAPAAAEETSSFDPRISRTKYAEQSAVETELFVRVEITAPAESVTIPANALQTPPFNDGLSFSSLMKGNYKTRTALRQLRDSSLALVESIVSEKAPEILPAIAAIRQANEVLSDWE